MRQSARINLRPFLPLLLALLYLPAAVAALPEAAVRAQTLIDVNPLLSGYGVRVVGEDGRLRLEGSVAHASDQALAAALCALVADGAAIDNALDLAAAVPKAPGGLFGDDEDLTTAAMLRQTLEWQTDTAGLDIAVAAPSIEVQALEGKVILSGTVTSSAERSVADTLAERVPGVTAVDSRLIIERPL